MMGSSCGTERGSRGRWRKPLRILVHGKGLEGGGLERRRVFLFPNWERVVVGNLSDIVGPNWELEIWEFIARNDIVGGHLGKQKHCL